MSDFEQPRKMIISVAGGYNTLLIQPPLAHEVFKDLLPPKLIGSNNFTSVIPKDYDDIYTGLQYRQEVELMPALPPVKYGKDVCTYLGKAGFEVELDETIYGVSPQTLVMMAKDSHPPTQVPASSRYL